MAVVEALGLAIVLGRDPVEADVTVRRSVSKAGIEERGAHAVTSEGRIDKEVVHDEDAIGNERVQTGIQAGETLKRPVHFGHQLHPEAGILLEKIEQAFNFLLGKRGAVEGEVALDQGKKLGAILPFRRTNQHRASLASGS